MIQIVEITEILGTVGLILGVMAVIALIETALPLHARTRWHRAHLGPNLALTFITFGTNALFNAALVAALAWAELRGLGLLRLTGMPSVLATLCVIVALDFAFYVAHVSMHHVPGFWRVHRVHHSDPEVDVTTTIRQHPLEGLIRYGFMACVAIALGASPAAFAIYRLWSALNGLFEHANVRVPLQLDALFSRLVVTPNMHKVHHSRLPHETNSNYGNIFAIFDRALGTFVPAERGEDVAYGLDGEGDERRQTTTALLALPLSPTQRPSRVRA